MASRKAPPAGANQGVASSSSGVAALGPRFDPGAQTPTLPPTLALFKSSVETSESAARTRPLGMEVEEVHLPQPLLSTTEDVAAAANLLALRQRYRKNQSNLARARSHLEFSQTCQTLKEVPQGLKVRVQCHALLKEETDIKEHFNTINDTAETGYVDALSEHYTALLQRLGEEEAQLERAMHTELASTSDQTTEEHELMIMKTKLNITKIETSLKQAKDRKLQSLRQPQPTSTTEGRTRMSRGARGARGGGRGRGTNRGGSASGTSTARGALRGGRGAGKGKLPYTVPPNRTTTHPPTTTTTPHPPTHASFTPNQVQEIKSLILAALQPVMTRSSGAGGDMDF